MANSSEMVLQHQGTGDLDDPFSTLPPLDPFDIKKEEVATQLAAIMVFSGVTRSQMAEKLQWKKSQLTRVLSGKANPTIKTIYEVSHSLGYDFDLVFRGCDHDRPRQLWEHSQAVATATVQTVLDSSPTFTVFVKSLREVTEEIASGNGQKYYVSSIQANIEPALPTIDLGEPKVAASPKFSWVSSPKSTVVNELSFY